MKDLTEIVCVLDRSGSMSGIIDDAIGDFNTFLKGQKETPGEAIMSIVLFDDQYDLLYNGKNLTDIPPFTKKTYVPRGSTALYDALGKTMQEVGKRLANTAEAERPDKVLFVILTDGYENSSRKFTGKQIKEMITHQRDVYSWEFLYLAANQDAFVVADGLGISRGNTLNFEFNADGFGDVFDKMYKATRNYRIIPTEAKLRRASLFADLPDNEPTAKPLKPDAPSDKENA